MSFFVARITFEASSLGCRATSVALIALSPLASTSPSGRASSVLALAPILALALLSPLISVNRAASLCLAHDMDEWFHPFLVYAP